MVDGRDVALVTGANKGIGRQTAEELARRGLVVLLGSRDQRRGDAAAAELAGRGVEVRPVALDVTDPEEVHAAADLVRDEYGRLDVLINNAGIVDDAPIVETTAAGARAVFEVNVLGPIAMIHAMLPLLRASRAPRIVNVSSTTASLGLTSAGTDFGGDAARRLAYASSKAALNMLTVQYARAFARDSSLRHVKINAATPGFTATDLNRHRGTRSLAEGARVVVQLALLPEDGPSGGFFNDQGPVPW
jgi:NAD(P)-dependent dehydrogenase (short-subunit alcohol dehydrogenase family)